MFKHHISKLGCHCFLSSGLLLSPSLSAFSSSSPSSSQSWGNVYDPSWRQWPGPPRPTPPSPAAFASNLLSVCRCEIGQALNMHPGPGRQPPPSSARPGSTPGCQSAAALSALHAPVRCRLVTGYLGFTRAAVPVSSSAAFFMAVKSRFSSPSSPLPHTLQINPFHHPPTFPPPPIPPPYLLLIPSC